MQQEHYARSIKLTSLKLQKVASMKLPRSIKTEKLFLPSTIKIHMQRKA
jgi:hypothetical protein